MDDDISFHDFNDDFVFADMENPASGSTFLDSIPIPKFDNYFNDFKCPPSLLEYVKDVQPNNYSGLNYDKENGSIEAIQIEVHI